MNSWLLLLYALPTRQSAGRVQVWRKLKKYGALPLSTSAYIMPDEGVHYERFQWLATHVRSSGGEANLIRLTQIEGLSHKKIIAMFNESREKDYRELAKDLTEFIRRIKGKSPGRYHADLEKLQARYKEIQAVDYFDCPKSRDVLVLLRHAEAPAKPRGATEKRIKKRDYQRKKWVTRPRPEIDRVASAWLIKRFMDTQAQFVFASELDAHRDAIPYDMYQGEFSHHGEDCTFETLVKRIGIEDPAVQAIAEMVHDADLEDGKFKRAECLGIDRVLKGWGKLDLKDESILDKGFEIFDALYACLKR